MSQTKAFLMVIVDNVNVGNWTWRLPSTLSVSLEALKKTKPKRIINLK